jgi:hypothetical protein
MNDLSALLQFLTDHPKILLLLAGWYLFLNFASALPKPEEVAAAAPGRPITLLVYSSFFHLTQGAAGNLARIIPSLRLLTGKPENRQL